MLLLTIVCRTAHPGPFFIKVRVPSTNRWTNLRLPPIQSTVAVRGHLLEREEETTGPFVVELQRLTIITKASEPGTPGSGGGRGKTAYWSNRRGGSSSNSTPTKRSKEEPDEQNRDGDSATIVGAEDAGEGSSSNPPLLGKGSSSTCVAKGRRRQTTASIIWTTIKVEEMRAWTRAWNDICIS